MNKTKYEKEINEQYSDGNIEKRIFAALAVANKNIESLDISDLAPMDELHIGGREATLKLGRIANIASNMKVLDVGSGIGGPARILAYEFGCRVVGIDLTKEFCDIATMLTKALGLDKKVDFRCADALYMPFEDESFDLVWSQHCSMNIADKKRLYAEYFRVLRTKGLLAIHDVVSGVVSPLDFPVPWARESSASFLSTPDELYNIVTRTGFSEMHWQDISDEALDWYKKVKEAGKKRKKSPFGPQLILGPDIAKMAFNMRKNISEKRAGIIEAIFCKL